MLALAGVDSLTLVSQKRYRGKTRSSSVAVRDFCFLVRARRCGTVSSSAHWKLVSYPFLWTTPAMLPVFLRPFTNALMWRAKETINGGSHMDFIIAFIDELL